MREVSMTVSAQTPINRSTGNGVTTVFPYDFKILAAADIQVTVDGVAKTLNVDYTVSGVGNDAGGNVTMTVAPANLTSVVRRRNMGLVRTTDYQDQGELPAATLDADIDATVLMIQQVDEQIGRALTLPAGVVGVSAELPEPSANAALVWNTDGDAIETKTLAELGAIGLPLSVTDGGTGATAAAQARTNLGAAAAGPLGSSGITGAAASGVNNDITGLLNSGGIQVATRVDVASASTVSLTGNPDDIRITGTTTITGFTAVVGRVVRVTFSGSLTLTNNANIVTQTGANIVTQAGDTCTLRATAANTVEVLSYVPAVLNQQTTRSMVRLNTANGYGSTNTKIRRFTNTVTNTGSDITYADSATLGASFTINTAGMYTINYSEVGSSGMYAGLSLNTTVPTTSVQSIPVAEVLSIGNPGANAPQTVSWSGYLAAGAVVRPHADGIAAGTPASGCQFTISRGA